MANHRRGKTYLGVTSNLPKRTYEHRNGLIEGHSKDNECKLLVWFEVFDEKAGKYVKTMRFEPQRTELRKVKGIKYCVIEEGSNISIELANELVAALPNDVVFIHLGDLNQIFYFSARFLLLK